MILCNRLHSTSVALMVSRKQVEARVRNLKSRRSACKNEVSGEIIEGFVHGGELDLETV